MSLAELKQVVETLSADERQDLAAHIWWCERRGNAEWRAEMSSRLDQAAQAPATTQQDLERIHLDLKNAGR